MTGVWPWPAELEGTVGAPRSHRVLLVQRQNAALIVAEPLVA